MNDTLPVLNQKCNTTFEDYQDDYSQLVGRFVLYEWGNTYNSKNNFAIRQITKVTKTGFNIYNVDGQFKFNGKQKGLSSKQNWSVVSECSLIDDSEKQQIIEIWSRDKKRKSLIQFIQTELPELPLEKLEEIVKIISVKKEEN